MSSDQPNQANNEELMQMAIEAARNGQKDGARMMFRQLYSRNRRNETAMLWLAKLATTEAERKQWLARILEVNPDNVAARRALDKMKYSKQASDNSTLIIFGGIAIAMLVLFLLIIFLVVTR